MNDLQEDMVLVIDHGSVLKCSFGSVLINHFLGQMQEESTVLQ